MQIWDNALHFTGVNEPTLNICQRKDTASRKHPYSERWRVALPFIFYTFFEITAYINKLLGEPRNFNTGKAFDSLQCSMASAAPIFGFGWEVEVGTGAPNTASGIQKPPVLISASTHICSSPLGDSPYVSPPNRDKNSSPPSSARQIKN